MDKTKKTELAFYAFISALTLGYLRLTKLWTIRPRLNFSSSVSENMWRYRHSSPVQSDCQMHKVSHKTLTFIVISINVSISYQYLLASRWTKASSNSEWPINSSFMCFFEITDSSMVKNLDKQLEGDGRLVCVTVWKTSILMQYK